MQESDVPESVLQEPHTPNQTLVRFFGSVSYGWMDVCYPFREHYETNSKPEGHWDGFTEALEEAKEYERTGQFIVLTAAPAVKEEDSSSEEEHKLPKRRAVVKRRRPAASSDDDAEFGDSDDEDAGPKKGKKKLTKKKISVSSTRSVQKPIKANKEQKLFAREIFAILKAIEKQLEENNLDGALALLKKFDPKTMTKRLNKDGLTVDAPGPYAQIETQVVHISRLGKFVHGLSKKHESDILGPYSSMLYRHLVSNARKELAIPDDIDTYISNQASSSVVPSAASEASNEQSESANKNSAPAAPRPSTEETVTSIKPTVPEASTSSMDVTSASTTVPQKESTPTEEIPKPIDSAATVPLRMETMEVDL